jgi:DNA-directed RNA polymerase specialized sigma24 family protein
LRPDEINFESLKKEAKVRLQMLGIPRQEHDDLLQHAIVKVLRSNADITHPLAYYGKAVATAALSWLRLQKRRRFVPIEDIGDCPEVATDHAEFEQRLNDMREGRDIIQRLSSSGALAKSHAATLDALLAADFDTTVAADALGISAQQFRVRKFRAYKAFGKILAKKYGKRPHRPHTAPVEESAKPPPEEATPLLSCALSGSAQVLTSRIKGPWIMQPAIQIVGFDDDELRRFAYIIIAYDADLWREPEGFADEITDDDADDESNARTLTASVIYVLGSGVDFSVSIASGCGGRQRLFTLLEWEVTRQSESFSGFLTNAQVYDSIASSICVPLMVPLVRPLTKSEVYNSISSCTGVAKKDLSDVFDALVDEITKALSLKGASSQSRTSVVRLLESGYQTPALDQTATGSGHLKAGQGGELILGQRRHSREVVRLVWDGEYAISS